MISKKRRDEDNSNVLEAPIAEVFPDDPVTKTETEEDEKYLRLANQLADLQKQNAELARTQMQLLTNPNWQSENNFNVQLEDPNKVVLVDPALDPDGFARGVTERTRIVSENARKQFELDNRRSLTVKERADNLKRAFAERYPELADDDERIDFISTRVAQEAQARGVNVERYMFQTTDKFVDDVAKRYVKVFGEPEEEDADDNFEDRRPASRVRTKRNSRNRNRSEDDDMVSRTSGIFGGTESGGRPTKNRDEESGPGMIEDIQEIQKKSGFW